MTPLELFHHLDKDVKVVTKKAKRSQCVKPERIEKEMKRVIAWWSGGIASAVACQKAIELFSSDYNVEVVFIDTKNEHEDTYRFLDDCSNIYKKEIKVISNEKYSNIKEVWRKYNSLNVAKGAICSSQLKKDVRVKYQDIENDYSQVFGFDYSKSEQNRAKNMLKNYPEINPNFPLIDFKYTKEDCIKEVESWGIRVPLTYELGFRNNNCFKTGCVQGGIGYWQKIKRDFPEKFRDMANIERELSIKNGKPITICSDQSKGKKVRLFLEAMDEFPDVLDISSKKGREPETLMECNGFCSTEEQLDLFDDILTEIKETNTLNLKELRKK